ncbi:DNA methyltransferase 3 isoform X2 [Andrena cerasifolii]|uniref:DNA methyltransferase 3 isoform X2 n=1 Tax=Andrena cerasifolii TaxID=2819439 RepID=UPI004037F0C4
MKPQGISSLVDQQQRKRRGGRDSVKSWAEKSVWSLVCAMELGLIPEPSLESVSFAAFSDGGALVETTAAVTKEFPSINSPIDAVANRSPREPLGLVARLPAQPPRKPPPGRRRAAKSTTAERNVYAGWRDRARNTTVENFWKSCKRKVGRPRKRASRNRQDLPFPFQQMDGDLFLHQTRSADLPNGIGYQDYQTSKLRDVDKRTPQRYQSASAVGRRSFACARTADRQVHRSNERERCVSKSRAKRKNNLKAAKIVEAEPSTVLVPLKNQAPTPNDRDEEVYTEDYWEYGQTDLCTPFIDPAMMNTRGSARFQPSPINYETMTEFPPFESNSLDDVDALPLAERISNGSKSSVEDEQDRSAGSSDQSERKYSGVFNDGSNDADLVDHEQRSTSVERRKQRTKRSLPLSSRSEKDDNDDPLCKSAESGATCNEKQASSVKRGKAGSTGSVIGASARGAPKIDAIQGKMLGNDSEYRDMRRVTRGSKRISKENFVGKLVWGSCSGWWPALIVDAGHVGMLSEAGKLWVYWIGEARISLLSEKTQIEPFSCNLKYRLTQNPNVARVRAIDATMQMLRKRLGCTLTKPYSTWIHNNFSQVIETLDEIKFYPYPPKIQQKLDHLKEKNAKVTEKYLLDQKRESQAKKVPEKPQESPQQNNVDLTRLPLRDQHPGVVTWAKIAGHNWWPAMIIDYRDCCMREPSFGCQWIMWYGDYKLSEVHHQLFLRFEKGIEKLRDYINNTKKHAYLVGVLQASKDHCSRFGCATDDWTLADAFKYFSQANRPARQDPPRKGDSVKIYDKYSTHIVKKLNELKNNPNIDDQRADDIKSSDDLRSVISGQTPLESLCLKCLKTPKDATEAHPFFEGSLCKDCSEQYKPCMFVFGNDAKCFYCTVCASSGTVIICDNEDCPRVYCTACMKHLLCPTTYDEVLQEDPWECFLCKSSSGSSSSTVVKPRPSWKDKIIDMFRTNCNSKVRVTEHSDVKRKIRVLSLFDGLSTGLLVLQKLSLVVDVYYASEIDSDALMVSASHFGDRIVQLGDVRDITKEKIKEIGPIDLLIGGSPCNDLSLANPARLGLYDPRGTGVLFFEYCRIMKLVKRINSGRRLFWMYENVASMPSEYRLEINKHLGQEPDVIDSADFSPQHRLRLYWHNLPIEPHFLSFQGEQDVQEFLTPHCQRYALVKKIRTVTTKVNSLKQGKLALKPILMKDESDSLWITELEEIFGFPRHYTDVKNLSATKRQRLIGKSWSVQTLTAILRPLCPFFECNSIDTN